MQTKLIVYPKNPTFHTLLHGYLEKVSHGQGNFKVNLPKLPDKKLEEYTDATCNCHGYKLRFLVKL